MRKLLEVVMHKADLRPEATTLEFIDHIRSEYQAKLHSVSTNGI